jgi:hypothetical protein
MQDLRYACRALGKNLLSSLVILASLGIGIGANSAIFNVLNALLLRPLPDPQPERLAAVWLHWPAIGIFRDWRYLVSGRVDMYDCARNRGVKMRAGREACARVPGCDGFEWLQTGCGACGVASGEIAVAV